jgi:pre-rRNA-processing protein IPI3
LLFPTFPLCVTLDPSSRALFSACEDGSLYLIELFAEKPLLGPSAEDPSTVVQVSAPFGMVPSDAGPASCIAVSYDGTQLLTGHTKGQILKWDVADNKTPVELQNLNSDVTNLIFLSPVSNKKPVTAATVVKPSQQVRNYTLMAQFDTELRPDARFDSLLKTAGFSPAVLESAISALQQPAGESGKEQELAKQNEELWEIVNEQRALQKQTLQKYVEAKSGQK